MIELRKIDEKNYQECLNLSVTESQAAFTKPNDVVLAEAWLYPYSAMPFAAYAHDFYVQDGDEIDEDEEHEYEDEGEMVGLIMPAFESEKERYEIWHLMIDQHHQGKGYGRKTLRQAANYLIKQYQTEEIYATIEPENKEAEDFYKEYGFTKLTRRVEKIDDNEIVLHLLLPKLRENKRRRYY